MGQKHTPVRPRPAPAGSRHRSPTRRRADAPFGVPGTTPGRAEIQLVLGERRVDMSQGHAGWKAHPGWAAETTGYSHLSGIDIRSKKSKLRQPGICAALAFGGGRPPAWWSRRRASGQRRSCTSAVPHSSPAEGLPHRRSPFMPQAGPVPGSARGWNFVGLGPGAVPARPGRSR